VISDSSVSFEKALSSVTPSNWASSISVLSFVFGWSFGFDSIECDRVSLSGPFEGIVWIFSARMSPGATSRLLGVHGDMARWILMCSEGEVAFNCDAIRSLK
jgi:hypothetical protein